MDTQNTGASAPAQDAQAPSQVQPTPVMNTGAPDAAPQATPQGAQESQAAPPVEKPEVFTLNQTLEASTQKEMVGSIATGFLVGELLIVVLLIASLWKVFTKANEAGWKSLIPFYNLWVMIKIARLPGYYLILMLIPLINIFASMRMMNRISHSFGRGTGFTVGLVFLPFIFYPILAFGSSEYTPAE